MIAWHLFEFQNQLERKNEFKDNLINASGWDPIVLKIEIIKL